MKINLRIESSELWYFKSNLEFWIFKEILIFEKKEKSKNEIDILISNEM